MRVIIRYKKWWHRFIPKHRKQIKISQFIIDHITEKPEFQQKVKERVTHELLYGRTK